MFKDGGSKEDVALFTINYVQKTLEGMTENILLKYGNLPLVFAGGVMSTTIIRRSLTDKFGAIFASAELSGDNAVGIAAMTSFLHEGLR
jgi:N6-L-threonylcarbamoyladenine synthase